MTLVWEHSTQKGSSLLLLLAIADHANEEGTAWPSVPTLAKKVRVTERRIQQMLRELQEEGELVITDDRRYGKMSNTFKLTVKPTSPMDESNGEAHFTVNGEAHFTPTVKPTSPNPSFNHHINHHTEEELDDFTKMRDLVEKLTGLMMSPNDVKTINLFVKDRITEEDIRAALKWRVDQNLKPAKTIGQLEGGVMTSRSKRIQAANARVSPAAQKDYTSGVPQYEDMPKDTPDKVTDKNWLMFLNDLPRPAKAIAEQLRPVHDGDKVTVIADTQDALNYARSRFAADLQNIYMTDVQFALEAT